MTTTITTLAPSVVEQDLLTMWNTALGRSDLGRDDGFFDHGGDSLAALAAVEQVNQRLGWDLNMGDLIQYPTVRELAAHRATPRLANGRRAMVRMSNRGARRPMVLIHAGTGMISLYSRLVRLLSDDRACYAIQSPRLLDAGDEGVAPLTSIPDMAEHYADLVEDELGEDEFDLVGWSAGGVIGLELARVCAERDLSLGRLIVLDSILWEPTEPDDELAATEFREDVLAQLGNGAAAPAPEPFTVDVVLDEVALALFGEARAAAGRPFVERIWHTYRDVSRALGSYRPEPVEVDALLLHADSNYTVDRWRPVLAGPTTIRRVDGEHSGLVQAPEAQVAPMIEHFTREEV